MPNLTLIFSYVFGDRAMPRVIPSGVTLNAAQQERAATAIQEKRDQFAFITKNPSLSVEFRKMLRDQHSTAMEELLYYNTADEITGTVDSGKYTVPSDDEITAQFRRLEQEYGYFGTDDRAADSFVKLFKASKLIADYVEENNSDDNSLAYIHAYKMMVLFKINPDKPTDAVDSFIATHAANAKKPIHDSLVLPIPKNIPPLKYLEKWQKFIKDNGTSVLSLFQQAAEIEKVLDAKEPFTFTLDSIKATASQLTYRNAAQNLELAKLCLQYNVTEENFNKCLKIQPKKADNLPHVAVNGSTVGHGGYHLVKLPVNDPRANILGHITNCCQSIGGHSERCVIDGITRENNGFYVLLQEKLGTTGLSLTRDDGQINYDKVEIVGQGYAWLSDLNNLTFDSWENRTPEPDNVVIQAMLPEFAKQCFLMKPAIGRVTIGTGGKTPVAYRAGSYKTEYPESMAEGHEYGDASQQASIALNPAVQQNADRINAKLREMDLDATVNIWSIKQAEWFHELLDESTVSQYQRDLGEGVYKELLKKAAIGVLPLLFYLHQEKMLTKDVADLLLLFSRSESNNIIKLLHSLAKADSSLITAENIILLAQHAEHAHHLGAVLVLLNKGEPSLLTDENRRKLAKHPEYAEAIKLILDYFLKNNPALITQDNFKLLTDHNLLDLEYIYSALTSLRQHKGNSNYEIATDENFKFCANFPKQAFSFASSLSSLTYNGNPGLITKETRELLVRYANCARDVEKVIACLNRADPALVTEENCRLIIESKDSFMIIRIMDILCKVDRGLITNENLRLLTEVENMFSFSRALIVLQNVPQLVTDENLRLLTEVQNKLDFADGLQLLYKAEHSLITDENFKLLAQDNGKYASKIFDAFEEIYDEDTGETPHAIFEKAVTRIIKPHANAAGHVASLPPQQQASTSEEKPKESTDQDLMQDDEHSSTPQ